MGTPSVNQDQFTEKQDFSVQAAAYNRVKRHLAKSFKRSHQRLWGGIVLAVVSTAIALRLGFFVFAPQDAEHALDGAEETILMVIAPLGVVGLLYPLLRQREKHLFETASIISFANIDLLSLLGKIMELRGDDTAGHNLRVALYTILFAEGLNLPSDKIAKTTKGALLHDVGKLAIPDQIVGKPGALTPEERAEMEKHVPRGLDIINQMHLLCDATDVVAFHHERYDGSGYPYALCGDQIPLEARLFALVDVFDALTSVRAYKPALTVSEALHTMRKERGSHFDPSLFDHFEVMAPSFYYNLPQDETGLKTMLVGRLTPYFDSFLLKPSAMLPEPERPKTKRAWSIFSAAIR